MTEEFQESEAVFPEKAAKDGKEIQYPKVDKRKTDKERQKKSSVPISIQEEFSGSLWIRHNLQSHSINDDDPEEEEKEEERLPPHVILEKRIAGKAVFSLCSGYGRTLKGRDLNQVRNSILKMTGFLES